MKELASENRRYGYLRLHAMLRCEGLVLNHKRACRIYTEHGLQVRTNNLRLLEPIGNTPPAEAEANFYAALDRSDMAA